MLSLIVAWAIVALVVEAFLFLFILMVSEGQMRTAPWVWLALHVIVGIILSVMWAIDTIEAS